MRSDERFAADPIGQPVDPQDLVELRRDAPALVLPAVK
jgi:hypothetical protein